MGDWIVLDEGAAILPAIAAMLLGWWGHARYLERDSGAIRSRVGFVVTQARIFLPLLIVPVAAVLAAQEIVERLMDAFGSGPGMLDAARDGVAACAPAADVGGTREIVGLAAAITALLIAPALVVPALSTAPLSSRDALDERVRELFAAQRIGLRGIRLWNTGGTLMNGVALGILPFCRWVLLSDALVDGLTPDETLAVTGHEAGHLRHRHALWLAGACIGSLGVLGALVGFAAPFLPAGPWIEWTVTAGVVLLVIIFFGAVSRACERQADAFAVSVCSPGDQVDAGAVESMRRALAVVAFANGIPPRRPSFRHGSIDGRRRRLAALAGMPKTALPIDRRMRVIKILILASLVATGAATLFEPRDLWPNAAPPAADEPAAAPSTAACGRMILLSESMPMKFAKMHGIGNDYVYVDADAEPVADPVTLARRVSNRHYGVGSDGLILVSRPSPGVDADVRMRMFNADGSESEMCGNGIRCVAKFAIDGGLSRAKPLRVETGRGVLSIDWRVGADGRVTNATVSMGEPVLAMSRIPAVIPGLDAGAPVIDFPLPAPFFGEFDGAWRRQSGFEAKLTLVSVGNPHAVFYSERVDTIPLDRIGPFIERHPWFPQRINVHVVQVLSPREVRMRTWERGSGETLACGTGASAVCVAGILTSRSGPEILAHLPGGDLELAWPGAGKPVRMTGPAVEVYRAELDVRTLIDPPALVAGPAAAPPGQPLPSSAPPNRSTSPAVVSRGA